MIRMTKAGWMIKKCGMGSLMGTDDSLCEWDALQFQDEWMNNKKNGMNG
jgi:hypothetical protein